MCVCVCVCVCVRARARRYIAAEVESGWICVCWRYIILFPVRLDRETQSDGKSENNSIGGRDFPRFSMRLSRIISVSGFCRVMSALSLGYWIFSVVGDFRAGTVCFGGCCPC